MTLEKPPRLRMEACLDNCLPGHFKRVDSQEVCSFNLRRNMPMTKPAFQPYKANIPTYREDN